MLLAFTIAIPGWSAIAAGRKGAARRTDRGDACDHRVRRSVRADVRRSTTLRSAVLIFLALGLFLMGLTYGPLGNRARGNVSDCGVRYTGASLGVQSRRHPRRIARARHRDVARARLRAAVRRLLPVGRRGADFACVAVDPQRQAARTTHSDPLSVGSPLSPMRSLSAQAKAKARSRSTGKRSGALARR